MTKEHLALIIPGLGNVSPYLTWWSKYMTRLGFLSEIYDPAWQKGKDDLSIKIDHLATTINNFSIQGYAVSLIGTSAGGSLALIVFHQLQDSLAKTIAISACLRKPEETTSKLKENFHNYPAHKQAVTVFESQVEPHLSSKEWKRILTMQPMWDNVVPNETMVIPNIQNKRMAIMGHEAGIITALTIYSKTIKNFIQKE